MDDDFIDFNLVTKSRILTEAISSNKNDNVLDFKMLVKVTHHTAPITIVMSDNHSKTVSLFLFNFQPYL